MNGSTIGAEFTNRGKAELIACPELVSGSTIKNHRLRIKPYPINIMSKKIIVILFLGGIFPTLFSQLKISLNVPGTMLENSCIRLAVEDAQKLFSSAPGCMVVNNQTEADISLEILNLFPTDSLIDSYEWS